MKTVSVIALLALVTGAAGVVGWWLRDAQLGTSEPAVAPERSEPGRTDDPQQACCGTDSLVDVIKRAVNAGRNLEARRQLRVLLDAEPRNSWALITLADIYLDEGRTDDAIATLLTVLDYPDDFSVVDAVQRKLDDAVQRHVELLDAPRIPSFYEYMTARLPADDRYRLAHAKALAAIGDFEAARYVLDRIGHNGVTAQEVDTLRSALDTIKDLPIRREGQRILASPNIAGRRVELLVDTGATRTALNASALRTLSARITNEVVALQTAAGVVHARVYVVEDLVFGEHVFEDLAVVRLDHEIPGVHGVLGMDVLAVTGIPGGVATKDGGAFGQPR